MGVYSPCRRFERYDRTRASTGSAPVFARAVGDEARYSIGLIILVASILDVNIGVRKP